jgi:hypothetical protein
MSELQLFPGPRLVRKSWVYDDDKGVGEWVSTDVTDRAFEYLFQELASNPEVTLADVFRLVSDEPIMQAVFRQESVAELCAEVRKGPVSKEGERWQEIEFLELYQLWNHDTSTGTFEEVGRYQLHGMGVVQEADIFEHGHLAHRKGERTKWAISLTPVRELLHLPVRVNTEVLICEADVDAKQYANTLQVVKGERITLGSFIREILWELSWHGSPEDSAKVSQGLKEQVAEIDAGTAKTTPHEDVFESLGFSSKKEVYAHFFVGSEDCGRSEVYRALHALEDVELAVDGLQRLLDGKLQVRPQFAALTGRGLRKAVREAQYGGDDAAVSK